MCRAGSHVDPFDLFARGGVQDEQLVPAKIRNEHVFPIQRELQPVAVVDRHAQCLQRLLADGVDDRNTSILCVRHPELLPVGGQVVSFRAPPCGYGGDAPIGRRGPATSWRRYFNLLDDGNAGRSHIRREQSLEVARHDDHVGPVLAGAHDPVDFVARRIVAADDLCALRREVQLSADEVESMRSGQHPEIDGRQGLSRRQVHDRDRVAARVVRDVRRLPVG